MRSPDQICKHAASQNIQIKVIQKDHCVLIEGNQAALNFLSQLIAAQANVAADCGFHIFPDGAGHTLFSIESDLGLYIHCLECSEC